METYVYGTYVKARVPYNILLHIYLGNSQLLGFLALFRILIIYLQNSNASEFMASIGVTNKKRI